MSDERTPLLVIGLDGGSWTVLGPAIDAGLMPNLARLRAGGAWGDLASTVPPFTAPAWSTFMTGKNPGQHGVLSFFRQDVTAYALTPSAVLAAGAAQRDDVLWVRLGAAGRRVGVVNVPVTYPPRPVNGFLVTGLMTPLGSETFTYPQALAQELGADYVIEPDYLREFTETSDLGRLPLRERMLADLDRSETVRTQACVDLIARNRPDFFMVVFASTDRLGHFFWDYLDPNAAGAADRDAPLLARVQAHFRLLDDAIGALVAAMGPGVTVLLMSDHGFGPASQRWAHANTWLREQGLLALQAGRAVSWTNPAFWKARLEDSPVKRWARAVLPRSAQRAIRRAERPEDLVDWPATRAYAMPLYANVTGVIVNLRGRQVDGCVEPGADYEAVRDAVLAAAAEWRDPFTGERLVRSAWRREALYHGEHTAQFPDVILALAPDYTVVPTLPPRTVTPADPTDRTGDHRPEGIFLAYGPAIRPGPLAGAAIADLAPTLYHLAGLPVPDDLDGRVLQEAFDPAWLSGHPVCRTAEGAAGSPAAAASIYTAEEEAVLTQHLAALGYL